MSSVRTMKKTGLAIVACALLALAAGAPTASAEALAPWWSVTSGARPTNLSAGPGKDEVQRLAVSATKGDFLIVELAKFRAAVVPFDASASFVQQQIETLYPARTVTVSEEASGEANMRWFKVTFPSQRTATLFTLPDNEELAELFGGEALSGANATVSDTELQEGFPSENEIVATAQNLGDTHTSGLVTVVDQLPAGLQATSIEAIAGGKGIYERGPVECALKTLTCTFSSTLPAYEQIEVRIHVLVQGAKSGEQNSASVSGGGAAGTVSAGHQIEVGGPQRFGIEEYRLTPENPGGSIDTQAGSHPFQLTSVLTPNSEAPDSEDRPRAAGLAKDLVAELPAGLIGNPTPLTQCTEAQFSKQNEAAKNALGDEIVATECPAQAAVGIATVTFNEPTDAGFTTAADPIFNMVPRPGEPARFAFRTAGFIPTFLDTSVRTGGDYGVTISSSNIQQAASVLSVKLTFWGVPGDSRHDHQRGWECQQEFGSCPESTAKTPPPFLIMPTSCEQPFETTLRGDSWGSSAKASEVAAPVSYRLPEGIDGCNHLPFTPTLSVTPDLQNSSTPTGLTVDVHVPQSAELNPEGLAESTLRDSTVTLPAGVTLNPAGADGLEACSEAQIGFSGIEPVSEREIFTDGLPQPFCANAAKIGTVKVKTPLLPNALEGAVYLASPAPSAEAGRNPFNSLIAMYLVAQDPVSGTLIKIPGKVVPDPVTGQLTATFHNTPELPFEDLELHFFGGSRAPLATPEHCGTYTTAAAFAPWSGNATATPSASFDVSEGPNGSSCPGATLPFSPALTAGTTSIQAGGFSPFTMTMSREDGNQNLSAIQLRMPPGMSGTLSTVKLCGEAQADAGTCGAESEIGETIVSVGLGGDPYSVKGGKVFITGPYKGAPFGLSIVNPANAGPFELGKVIVRAKIEVDPITSVLTITTDSEGPYKIPTIIDGIPLEIKHINVTINRPNFTFNPTNCSPLTITGKLLSVQGASSALAVPFQATNCAVLAFKPKLTALATGKTSRADGAGLSVKLTYPAGPYDANIAKVKVDLPKQLPSRLTTLQKACPAATFEANPASCPAGSIVGSARATTPVLPVPLAGPAYFVSYGGAKFPELVIVLTGYGVTVDLHGETFINKAGITSSTFKTIPDVPVGTFELTLPSGTDSALAANGNLCKSKLAMPTLFVGQNGATINSSTPIGVSGCKATVSVVRHSVKGATVTLAASVPSAGKLVAEGQGLSREVKRTGKAGTLTFSLKLSAHERAVLRSHPGRKLKVAVKLVFTPTHGQKLAAGVTLNVG